MKKNLDFWGAFRNKGQANRNWGWVPNVFPEKLYILQQLGLDFFANRIGMISTFLRIVRFSWKNHDLDAILTTTLHPYDVLV